MMSSRTRDSFNPNVCGRTGYHIALLVYPYGLNMLSDQFAYVRKIYVQSQIASSKEERKIESEFRSQVKKSRIWSSRRLS